MSTWAFYGSIVTLSIVGPLFAALFPGIKWRYKIPPCLLLANVVPTFLTVRLDEDGYIGSTFGVAILFGLVISSFLIFFAVSYAIAREHPDG